VEQWACNFQDLSQQQTLGFTDQSSVEHSQSTLDDLFAFSPLAVPSSRIDCFLPMDEPGLGQLSSPQEQDADLFFDWLNNSDTDILDQDAPAQDSFDPTTIHPLLSNQGLSWHSGQSSPGPASPGDARLIQSTSMSSMIESCSSVPVAQVPPPKFPAQLRCTALAQREVNESPANSAAKRTINTASSDKNTRSKQVGCQKRPRAGSGTTQDLQQRAETKRRSLERLALQAHVQVEQAENTVKTLQQEQVQYQAKVKQQSGKMRAVAASTHQGLRDMIATCEQSTQILAHVNQQRGLDFKPEMTKLGYTLNEIKASTVSYQARNTELQQQLLRIDMLHHPDELLNNFRYLTTQMAISHDLQADNTERLQTIETIANRLTAHM